MKLTDEHKDFFSSIVIALVSMILFVLLMGTIAVWGQSAGQKIRSRISPRQSGQLLNPLITPAKTPSPVTGIALAPGYTDTPSKPLC